MGGSTANGRALIAAGSAAAVAGVTALALLVALPSGIDGPDVAPTVADAARLATRPAATTAPPTRADAPTLLAGRVDAVPFPSWERELGWRATRARADRLGRRRAGTVFYERDGAQIGYTIVSGPPLAPPADAMLVRRGSIALAVLEDGERTVVSWRCERHTCVLSGEDVDRGALLALADGTGGGTSRAAP